ncbi:CsbD family protein [Amycolatopsis sp. WAC 01375]|uniref:CsbD family protein n=1 Tax=Amycolatopsis sp. WAC 01375 TaxID=2203194 RepID=UPI000F798B0C|nr:CsbD family protein [Amycolatopsis sp. WAC 01375]RSM71685.1 CsbD family protein [Amycolatopsis sp. WAC 01375]
MSLGDKISNKAEEFGGKAKEAAGDATGNEELRAEGQADQAKAGLKGAVEDVKDAVGDAADKLRDTFKK